jgi:hypothetical protein
MTEIPRHLGLGQSEQPNRQPLEIRKALREVFDKMDVEAQYTISDHRSSLSVAPDHIANIYAALGREVPEPVQAILEDPNRKIDLNPAYFLRGNGRGRYGVMSLEDRARSIIGAVHRLALTPPQQEGR